MMSELWVAVETSMRAIRSGGGVARGAKAVESLKKNIYFEWKRKPGKSGGK